MSTHIGISFQAENITVEESAKLVVALKDKWDWDDLESAFIAPGDDPLGFFYAYGEGSGSYDAATNYKDLFEAAVQALGVERLIELNANVEITWLENAPTERAYAEMVLGDQSSDEGDEEINKEDAVDG